jgi:hypothetical protein
LVAVGETPETILGADIINRVDSYFPGYLKTTYLEWQLDEERSTNGSNVEERLCLASIANLVLQASESGVIHGDPLVIIGLPLKQSQLVYEYLIDEIGFDPRKLVLIPPSHR